MSKLIDKILAEAKINERIVNLFPQDVDERIKYADQVWDILQSSYAKIGGIHGSGFTSKEDMINNIPMWKLSNRDGKVDAAVMYKDKGGRKRVAGATDGTPQGKKDFVMMGKEELSTQRSYGEISGAPLAIQNKGIPNLEDYAIPVEKVKEILPDDEIRLPPPDDAEVMKYPKLANFFYQRKIGDHWHTKIMLGKTNQPIKKK